MKTVLCPVDLSQRSYAALELATTLAAQLQAQVMLVYVSPRWLPEETMFGSEAVQATIDADRQEFENLRPTDSQVPYDHRFVEGNAGPEIVKLAADCDMVVMSTHGRSGLARLVMGSVTQYVLRHAPCTVVTVRPALSATPVTDASGDSDSSKAKPMPKTYVTEVMKDAPPIHRFDKMTDIVSELAKARQTGAPVVDEIGACVGILTSSDIDRYHDLKQRLAARDETVVDEIFETDEFGQRRAGNCDFEQVHRHMTSPVITIDNGQTCLAAAETFQQNPEIHHLVVVDERNRPQGILEAESVAAGE